MTKSRTVAARFALAAAATVAALATAPAVAAAAPISRQAEFQPTYRCVLLEAHEPPAVVGRHCEALRGAPEEGPIFGPFRIESPRGMVQCEPGRPSGFARIPEAVEGRFCRFVEHH